VAEIEPTSTTRGALDRASSGRRPSTTAVVPKTLTVTMASPGTDVPAHVTTPSTTPSASASTA
jgi:hypothetical protein